MYIFNRVEILLRKIEFLIRRIEILLRRIEILLRREYFQYKIEILLRREYFPGRGFPIVKNLTISRNPPPSYCTKK